MSVLSVVTTGGVSAHNFGKDRYSTAYNDYNWKGDLAELIVYGEALTGPQRTTIEEYLSLKYGLDPVAARPTASPNGGAFSGSVEVVLQTRTPRTQIRYTVDGSEPVSSSALYDEPLVLGLSTTLKAKAFRADLAASPTLTVSFWRDEGEFSPKGLPGLALWWRADAGVTLDGGRVMGWADQSDQGNDGLHAASGVTLPEWQSGALNGLPLLRFDGTDYLDFTTRLNGTIRTVFWVVRDTSAADGIRTLLGDTAGYTYDFRSGSASSQTIWGSNTHASIRNGQTWLNGEAVDGTLTNRPSAMSVLSVVTTGGVSAHNFGKDRYSNAYNDYNWKGELAELIIFHQPLSADDVAAVESYLAGRYGIVSPFIQP
jgi:hypothetical protein